MLSSSPAAKWLLKRRQMATESGSTSGSGATTVPRSPLAGPDTSTCSPLSVAYANPSVDEETEADKTTSQLPKVEARSSSWWNSPLFGGKNANKSVGAASVIQSQAAVASEPNFVWPVADIAKYV